MPGRIVVPLDGSERARRVLPHAEALARLTGARVLPVRAVQRSAVAMIGSAHIETERVLEAIRYLDDVTYELSIHEVPNERGIAELVPPGMNTADWILEQAVSREGNLIAMSTSARSGLGRLLLGSVAENVLARSPVPVLFVRASDPGPELVGEGQTLLVPLDGSAIAEAALRPATALSVQLGRRLVLLYAAPASTPARAPRVESAVRMSARAHESREEMQRYLEDIARAVHTEGAEAQVEVRTGDPVDSILAATREHMVTLIVMAAQRRTGMNMSVLDSVAAGVLKKGSIPVVLAGPLVTKHRTGETEASLRQRVTE